MKLLCTSIVAIASFCITTASFADIYQYSDCDGNGTLLLTELDAEPGVDLSGLYLGCADLYNANLNSAYLADADLSGADLSGADLSQVLGWETATWTHATYNFATQLHPNMDPDALGMRHVEQTIVVGGGGNSNIQDAIDSITDNWTGPTEILVMPGTYTDIHSQVINPSGHALWIHSSDGADVTFIDGENTRRGIVCISQEDNVIIEDLTIRNCYAQHGAGMRLSNSTPKIISCVFDNNEAYGFGGGMYISNTASPTVDLCKFTNNTALDGGGVRNYGNSPTFTNCTFFNNNADTGGGIHNYASHATYTGCILLENNATSFGGGIHNQYGSNPDFTDCTVDGNIADTGGGIRNDANSNPTFVNCNIFDNSAVYGGGVQNHNSSPSFNGCVIETNSGTGMLSLLKSNPSLENTTICNNTPLNIDGPYSDLGGNTVCIGCSSDLNSDGNVNIEDLLQLIAAWGNAGGVEDLDEDGIVDIADLLTLVGDWGPCG